MAWRLRAWVGFVVASPCLWTVACLLATPGRTAGLALAVAAASTAALVPLIVTTPPAAIRLPVRTSTGLIGGLTLWTWSVHAASFERTPAGWIAAGVSPIVAAALASTFARRRATPWWAGVLLWSPATLGPLAVPLPWSLAGGAAVAATLAALGRLADRGAVG